MFFSNGRKTPYYLLALILIGNLVKTDNYALGQITPDNSLGSENSIVTQQENRDLIEGGAVRGNNLFHSFQEFNVLNQQQVYFANPQAITNIFSRVTGNNPSQILGTLGVEGTANLFLLNPNGIIFGNNAQLDLNGSFTATTGEILFDDGSIFSTSNSTAQTLLTISVPLGVQFNDSVSQGNIQLNQTQLNLKSEQDITLSGNTIELNQSSISNSEGDINLNGNSINLLNQSSLASGDVIRNVSGDINPNIAGNMKVQAGNINIEAVNVNISGTSQIITGTNGEANAGNIRINASESFTISEQSQITNKVFISGEGNSGTIEINSPSVFIGEDNVIATTTIGQGDAGRININSERFLLDGGLIDASTEGSGQAGSVFINSTESIEIRGSGFEALQAALVSQAFLGNRLSVDNFRAGSIIVVSNGEGNAGDINIVTDKLNIDDGALLVTSTLPLASGKGGNIDIKANSLKMKEAFIATGTFNPQSAGNIKIVANDIELRTRGQVSTATFGIGKAGNISVFADNISIFSDQPNILDSAGFIVSALGPGNAGDIFVEANSLKLDQSLLIATSNSGEGGNINVQIKDMLVLQNASQILTQAGVDNNSTGNGGNITISSPLIVSFPDRPSQIAANAFLGEGGNIRVFTQGIFGAKYLELNASSVLGIDGIITISNPNIDEYLGLVDIAVKPEETNDKIVAGCAVDKGNRFIVLGKGGLAHNPTQILTDNMLWFDNRQTELSSPPTEISSTIDDSLVKNNSKQNNSFIPATGWVINNDGSVALTSSSINNVHYSKSDC